MTDNGEQLNFAGLVEAIRQVHEHSSRSLFERETSRAGRPLRLSLLAESPSPPRTSELI
jgi:hypothetical protein